MKVREFFTDETRWCKDAMAKTPEGRPAGTNDPAAACRCLGGAIIYCYSNNYSTVEKSDEVFRKVYPAIGTENITAWNDFPERTFADVKALVEELDI